MSKRKDANDHVREGKPLDPSSRETLVLEVDAKDKCAGLDLEHTENGLTRSTQRNAITLLRSHPLWHGVIGYDHRAEAAFLLRKPPAYAGRDDTFPRTISDTDQTAVIEWLSYQTGGTDFPDAKVRKAIDFVARVNGFDPVADYLTGLAWDGRSRLDEWTVRYLGVPDCMYARRVGAKFLISAVARALQPGCQVDHVLVLEGAQGIGKTTALSILAGRYHRADLPPLDSREVKEALRGCWIAELGELVSMKKSELTAAKNFLTLREDTYRLPYGTRSETRPRRMVFAATTNESEYLRDQSGNRRFWPVECTAIDLASLARDRDQIWAEAVVRYRRHEPWHLHSDEEIAVASLEQEKRRESDPWEERVAKHAAANREFTASEVLSAIGVSLDRQTQRDKNRLSRILQALGYRSEQVRVGDARIRVYRREPLRARKPPLSRVSLVDPVEFDPGPRDRDDATSTRDTRDKDPTSQGWP
jgi:predicted P-loop ATPase